MNFWYKNTYLQFSLMNFSRSKWKIVNNTRNTYIWVKILLYIVVRCSSCSCKWFSLKFTQCATVLYAVSNQEVTLKRLISILPIAQKLYVGALNDLCEMYKFCGLWDMTWFKRYFYFLALVAMFVSQAKPSDQFK